MDKFVIIVAGGSGLRMGHSAPKQFLEIEGKAIIWYSLRVFVDAFSDIRIIVVLPAEFIEAGTKTLQDFRSHITAIVPGGPTRFSSVRNGMRYVKKDSVVFVHDAVRCLVTTTLIH